MSVPASVWDTWGAHQSLLVQQIAPQASHTLARSSFTADNGFDFRHFTYIHPRSGMGVSGADLLDQQGLMRPLIYPFPNATAT